MPTPLIGLRPKFDLHRCSNSGCLLFSRGLLLNHRSRTDLTAVVKSRPPFNKRMSHWRCRCFKLINTNQTFVDAKPLSDTRFLGEIYRPNRQKFYSLHHYSFKNRIRFGANPVIRRHFTLDCRSDGPETHPTHLGIWATGQYHLCTWSYVTRYLSEYQWHYSHIRISLLTPNWRGSVQPWRTLSFYEFRFARPHIMIGKENGIPAARRHVTSGAAWFHFPLSDLEYTLLVSTRWSMEDNVREPFRCNTYQINSCRFSRNLTQTPTHVALRMHSFPRPTPGSLLFPVQKLCHHPWKRRWGNFLRSRSRASGQLINLVISIS